MMYNLTVESYEEYQREMFKLMYDKGVSLTLSITNETLWPYNAPPGNTHMIKELHIKGDISTMKLFSILGSMKFVQKLRITNINDNICQNAEGILLNFLPMIINPDMLELTLDEFKACHKFLATFTEKTKFENLQSLKYTNGIIFESNVAYIKKLINSARKTIRSIEFRGTRWLTPVFDDELGTLISLDALEISVYREVARVTQILYFSKNFCNIFPLVRRIAINSGLLSWNQFLNISDCVALEYLKIGLKVPAGKISVNLSTFVTLFPKLQSLNITLYFTNPDNQLGCKYEGKNELDNSLEEFNLLSNCIDAQDIQHSEFMQ